MPVKWNPEMEREMLLIAIGDLRPSTNTWQVVAEKLGQGLNANAVSQKFYKLKREAEQLSGNTSTNRITTPSTKSSKTAVTTPADRKRKPPNQGMDETPTKKKKRGLTEEDEVDETDDIDVKEEKGADE